MILIKDTIKVLTHVYVHMIVWTIYNNAITTQLHWSLFMTMNTIGLIANANRVYNQILPLT